MPKPKRSSDEQDHEPGVFRIGLKLRCPACNGLNAVLVDESAAKTCSRCDKPVGRGRWRVEKVFTTLDRRP